MGISCSNDKKNNKKQIDKKKTQNPNLMDKNSLKDEDTKSVSKLSNEQKKNNNYQISQIKGIII